MKAKNHYIVAILNFFDNVIKQHPVYADTPYEAVTKEMIELNKPLNRTEIIDESSIEFIVNFFEKGVASVEEWTTTKEKAKQMYKNEICKTWENGYEHGACVNEEENKYHGIQYYKEVFETK